MLPRTAHGGRAPARPAPSDENDSALLAGAAAGDIAAFERLYRAYHPRLSRFIGLMTRRRPLIEESLNDTMLVVWKRSATYNGQCKVSTWIFAIAYRTTLKALREQEPIDSATGRDETPSDAAGPEQLRLGRESAAALARALQSLTPEHRSALILTYFHDLAYSEIAQIVDCPIDTVKTRVFHAKRRLRALLSGELGDWL